MQVGTIESRCGQRHSQLQPPSTRAHPLCLPLHHYHALLTQPVLSAAQRAVLCRCSSSDDDGPSTSQIRLGPTRKPWRAPRVRKPEAPSLKPTSTLCWVSRQLVVLLDPKRQRLMYILAPSEQGDAAEQQLTALMHAAEATAVFFGEHVPGQFKRLADIASGTFGVYTLCIPIPPIVGMSAFQDPEHDAELQLPGTSRAGWLQTRLRRDARQQSLVQAGGYSQVHGDVARRGVRGGSMMSQLRALIRSRGRAWPHRRRGACPGGPHSPPIDGWDSFVTAYQEAMKDGFALSPDVLLLKNQHLEEGSGEPDALAFNCNMPLGSDPEDYTAFIRTRHETSATQQYLEQCLRAESGYVQDMTQLEQQWSGQASDLDQEWGGAQQANTTTGRAKQGAGSGSVLAPRAGADVSSQDVTEQGAEEQAGVRRPQRQSADGAQDDQALSSVPSEQPVTTEAGCSSSHSSSSSTLDSGSSMDDTDVDDSADAGSLASTSVSRRDIRLLAKPVRRAEDDRSSGPSASGSAPGAASDPAPGVVPSTRQSRRASNKVWGRQVGSGRDEQEEAAQHTSPASRDTSASSSGSSSSSSSGSSSGSVSGSQGNGHAGPPSNGSSSRELNRDLEIAELLLGRKATLSDVAQLKAAFAQAQAVEAAAAGTDAATGLPLPALLLKQSLESLMVGSSRAGALLAGAGAEGAAGRAGSAVVSGGRVMHSDKKKRRRLAVPAAVHRLLSSAAFSSQSSAGAEAAAASTSSSTMSPGQLQASVGECMQLLRPSARPSHRYVMGRDIVLVVSSEQLLQELAKAWDVRERRCMLPGVV